MSFELTEVQKNQVCRNSIERVINNAICVAEHVAITRPAPDHIIESANILIEDLEELKRTMCILWDRERDTIFRASNDMEAR